MWSTKNLVLFSLWAANLVQQPAPELALAQGRLAGSVSDDGSYFQYVGIPYATTSPETRFQAPGPPPSWEGILKATDHIYMCLQNTRSVMLGREDCLTINVYVPNMATGPLPVMVYIHGGAFVIGSGGKFIFGPDYLVKHDVIIVTFNYRLGPLGFMCLNIPEAPGNAGLKDQVAAFRWVKKNIAAFGGDPDNVTAFGESAGAVSLSILVVSEAADGLFKRAIIHSGSSIANWAINKNPIWVYSQIAKELGYETEDPRELYNMFKDLPVKDLFNTRLRHNIKKFVATQLLHLPCVEKPFPGIEPIITDLPYNILQKKKFNISIIYGSNSNEGLFVIHDETPESLKVKNDGYLFDSDLVFETDQEANAAAKEVRKFYFGDDTIDMSNILNMSDLYTHLDFEMPVLIESETLVRNTDKPIYNYYFDYAGKRNLVKFFLSVYSKSDGASHGDELCYLFKQDIWPNFSEIWDQRDNEMISTLTKLWTNFAKYGEPSPDTSLDLPRWTPSTKDGLKLLYIGKEMKMGPVPNPEALEMWRRIFKTFRRKITWDQ